MSRLLLIGVMMALIGCRGQKTEPPREPLPPIDPALTAAVVQGNSAFATELYRTLSGQPGNMILSPYSLSTALAMTYPGARNASAMEFVDVCRFPEATENAALAFAHLAESLRSTPNVEWHSANALWGQRGYGFRPEFLQLGERYFGASFREIDFRETADARRNINTWIGEQTRGQIPELLGADALNENMRLILTNAVSFKGKWATKFDARATHPELFYVEPGEAVQVPMMRGPMEIPYTETADAQIAEFPYSGGKLALVIVLPRRVDQLPQIEAVLNAAQIKDWCDRLRPTDALVTIPKFRLQNGFDARDALRKLGMATVFDEQKADFSGMTSANQEPLYISGIVHHATIAIDEEGATATAATGVKAEKKSAIPESIPEFRANRPFLFFIRHRDSGSILFLGRVKDPKA